MHYCSSSLLSFFAALISKYNFLLFLHCLYAAYKVEVEAVVANYFSGSFLRWVRDKRWNSLSFLLFHQNRIIYVLRRKKFLFHNIKNYCFLLFLLDSCLFTLYFLWMSIACILSFFLSRSHCLSLGIKDGPNISLLPSLPFTYQYDTIVQVFSSL